MTTARQSAIFIMIPKKMVKDKSTDKTVTRDYYLDDTNILVEKVSGSGNRIVPMV